MKTTNRRHTLRTFKKIQFNDFGAQSCKNKLTCPEALDGNLSLCDGASTAIHYAKPQECNFIIIDLECEGLIPDGVDSIAGDRLGLPLGTVRWDAKDLNLNTEGGVGVCSRQKLSRNNLQEKKNSLII